MVSSLGTSVIELLDSRSWGPNKKPRADVVETVALDEEGAAVSPDGIFSFAMREGSGNPSPGYSGPAGGVVAATVSPSISCGPRGGGAGTPFGNTLLSRIARCPDEV